MNSYIFNLVLTSTDKYYKNQNYFTGSHQKHSSLQSPIGAVVAAGWSISLVASPMAYAAWLLTDANRRCCCNRLLASSWWPFPQPAQHGLDVDLPI